MKKLKNRLYTVSTLVPNGARVADIGCDHGHLPIYLICEGIASFCIASDKKENPLSSAKANIEKVGLCIETRLGSGLSTIDDGEVDCITIAGMGGEVIASILEAAPWVKDEKYTLVLQPMTSADALRRYLCEKGFSIQREIACVENRKVYSVIKAVYTGDCVIPDEFFCRVGKLIPESAAAVLYIEKQKRIIEDLIADRKAANLDTALYDEVYVKLLKLLSQ